MCLVIRSDFSIETDQETEELRCDNDIIERSSDVINDAEYDKLFDRMQVVGSEDERSNKKKRKLRKSTQEDSSNDRDTVSTAIILL